MRESVASAARRGRQATLEALVPALVDAIGAAPTVSVPELAGRLVDVLKRVGGPDASVLVGLRDRLAVLVDELVLLQGEVDRDGKPTLDAGSLAPMVRRLVEAVEAIDRLPQRSSEVSKVDELAGRRRAKAGDSRSASRRRDAG